MPAIANMISTAYFEPVETLLRAGANDRSLEALDNPRAAAIALFGAVTTSALTYLITDDTLDEDLIARTIHDVVFTGIRPR